MGQAKVPFVAIRLNDYGFISLAFGRSRNNDVRIAT